MESISLSLAKHIANSLNQLIDKDKTEANILGLPYTPFFYAADILQIIDKFNKAK